MMRTDGGEARRVTAARHGVRDFGFSPDGAWLVFLSGDDGREQLHALPVEGMTGAVSPALYQ